LFFDLLTAPKPNLATPKDMGPIKQGTTNKTVMKIKFLEDDLSKVSLGACDLRMNFGNCL